jgi:hypothetical protein
MADAIQFTIFGNLIAGLQSVLNLTPARCFEVARPQDLPTIPPGNDWFLTICWGDSNWPPGEQIPGNVTEEPDISVTIYTRLKTDQSGHDMYLLRDEKAGLFAIRNMVINALLNKRLCASARETIKVRNSTSGEVIKNTRDGTFMGMMRVTFAAPYDIDIPDGP